MSNDTESIFLFIEKLPTEVTISIVILIFLCCFCTCKDCICDFIRDRRASRRIRRLEEINIEKQEMDIIQSLERRTSRNPPSSRGVQV